LSKALLLVQSDTFLLSGRDPAPTLVTLPERAQRGRLGGYSQTFVVIYGMVFAATLIFVIVAPLAAAAGAFDSDIALGKAVGASAIAGFAVGAAGVGILRLFTTGVRIQATTTTIYRFGTSEVIPTETVREFSQSENGAGGLLETVDGRRIALLGVNLVGLGSRRQRRCIDQLNATLSAVRTTTT
jgi:hypothetical protein